MRKLMLATVLFLAVSGTTKSQTVKLDANGNYVQGVSGIRGDSISLKNCKATGKTYTTKKGDVYPVWLSPNGKLFVIHNSKNGGQYKQYLKLEGGAN